MNEGFLNLLKIGLQDLQIAFDIKQDLYQEYVEKEIFNNYDLFNLIKIRESNLEWEKFTNLGGPGTTLNALALYCLIRYYDMSEVLETGTSGGYYTSFMLSALENNWEAKSLISLELSDDKSEIGKLVPLKYRLGLSDIKWNLQLGKNSLEYLKNNKHSAQLYSHDSLHTFQHMNEEVNEFEQSESNQFIIFVDDQNSDDFWNFNLQSGRLCNSEHARKFNIKYISGQESRLKGHLGGFIKYSREK